MSPNFTVDDAGPVINAVRESYVSRLFVEFLQRGGPKPHVVLRLVLSPRAVAERREWLGCRLSMACFGALEGVFYITPLRYADTSNAAHASFEFGLRTNSWTVNNYISAITQPDLTDFNFVGGFYEPQSIIEYLDGCRDFISQVFVTLHRWGVVNWNILRIDRGTFDGSNLKVDLGITGFHEIIGYNYRNTQDRLTLVDSLPLARGTFLDQTFRRTLNYQPNDGHSYLLPYNPPISQPGDVSYNTGSTALSSSTASPYNWTTPQSTTSTYRTAYPREYSTLNTAGPSTYQANSSARAESSVRVGEWSEWSWNETWSCEVRSRSNPTTDGGKEWDYRRPPSSSTTKHKRSKQGKSSGS